MIFQSEQEKLEWELITNYIIPIGVVVIALFILYRLLLIFQFYYVSKFAKPLCLHFYFRLNKLTPNQFNILRKESEFFRALSQKHQRYFEHRVATIIRHYQFIGKDGLNVEDRMIVMISATLAMLTFGFNKYLLHLINTVIIYPKAYYSTINEAYHKGETNPRLKSIVFSWEDFEHGYKVGDDNLNLGIHEFGHAIHLNAFTSNDASSLIFNQGFIDLTTYLQNNEKTRNELIASKYFRAYAYTNQFEFFAVLLENFIETPLEFKIQFSELYGILKRMLNFNFNGY